MNFGLPSSLDVYIHVRKGKHPGKRLEWMNALLAISSISQSISSEIRSVSTLSRWVPSMVSHRPWHFSPRRLCLVRNIQLLLDFYGIIQRHRVWARRLRSMYIKTSTVLAFLCFSYNLGTWTGQKCQAKGESTCWCSDLLAFELFARMGGFAIEIYWVFHSIPISQSHPSHIRIPNIGGQEVGLHLKVLHWEARNRPERFRSHVSALDSTWFFFSNITMSEALAQDIATCTACEKLQPQSRVHRCFCSKRAGSPLCFCCFLRFFSGFLHSANQVGWSCWGRSGENLQVHSVHRLVL